MYGLRVSVSMFGSWTVVNSSSTCLYVLLAVTWTQRVTSVLFNALFMDLFISCWIVHCLDIYVYGCLKRKLEGFNLKKQREDCSTFLNIVTLSEHFFCIFKQCFSKGCFYFVLKVCFILSGVNYCMCAVTCGCNVLYQVNLTGWGGGSEEQRAWTSSPQKNGWMTKCSSEVFQCKTVEVNIHVRMFAECTSSWRVISNCTCVTWLKCCNVRILFLYNWMKYPILTAGKQYRGSVHVCTFTMMFQCGCVKGKYHCYIHSRILVFPLFASEPMLHGSNGMI